MNRFKKFFIAALLAAVIACPVSVVAANAAMRGDSRVAVNTLDANKFVKNTTGSDSSVFTENGVMCPVPGADTAGGGDAWRYKARIPGDNETSAAAFSFKTNDVITLKLSAKLYDAEGNVISKSQNSNALDIYVHNKATNAQIGGIRIWTNSDGGVSGSHTYFLYGNGWDNYGAGYKIMGDATAESEFVLQIDKTNFISSLVDGRMTPLGTEAFIADRRTAMSDVEEIYILVNGENGFTKTTEITVKEINGQSFASSDGAIADTVAPVFENTALPATLQGGEEYTIPVNAYDLLGAVTYQVKAGDGAAVDGKTFTPTAAGDLTVTLIATDAAGNSSQKVYHFTVVAKLEAPIITKLPELADGNVDYLSHITFPKPEFEDATGVATTVLKLYRAESEDTPLATLSENSNGEFQYFIGSDFETGNYKVVYEVTNSIGTTVSDPISLKITVNAVEKAEFVEPQTTRLLADYTETGIRMRSRENYKRFYLNGIYDIKEGLDVKFIVKDVNSAGTVNGCSFVSLILVNVDDPTYYAFYRVWLNQSGGDRPCNVYLSTAGHFVDHTDAGWITRTCDDVDGQFHMGFNMEDTFVGERLGGIQKVDVYEVVETWLKACPSMNFRIAFEASNLTPTDDMYYEFTVTEFNGQKFASPITWNDAYLSVQSEIPQMIKKDETLKIDAYSKDLRGATTLTLTVTPPAGEAQTIEFEGNSINYTFDKLGVYKLSVSTVGINGNEVKQEFEISCKESVDPVTIELSSEYNESYDKNATVTILGAEYSENAVTKTITVKKPDGSTVEVNAGDTFHFEKSGIYTITYFAKDGQSDPNKAEKIVTINVPDTEKPVIEVKVEDKYVPDSKVTPMVTITDDSVCDVTVTLKKPDGSSVKLSESEGYAFTVDGEGEYTITVVAEDEYGNKETVEKTFTVKADSGVVWIVVGCVAGVLVIGAVVLVLLKMRKKKGQEQK